MHQLLNTPGYYMHSASNATTVKNYSSNSLILEHHEAIHKAFWTKNYNNLCLTTFKSRSKMNIPVVYEDDTENEFEIQMCCPNCAKPVHGLVTGTGC